MINSTNDRYQQLRNKARREGDEAHKWVELSFSSLFLSRGRDKGEYDSCAPRCAPTKKTVAM
jgi:hypothetical protein